MGGVYETEKSVTIHSGEVISILGIQRLTAEGAVLSIRNGGRVFLPANRRKRGLENPRSVKKHMIEFQERINPDFSLNFILSATADVF